MFFTFAFSVSVMIAMTFGSAIEPKPATGAPMYIEGRTMGTTYHVTYFDSQNRNFQADIDTILVRINKSISTYDPSSEVSVFNRAGLGLEFRIPYFYQVLEKSKIVYEASGGAFDPTVMPLVNAWGFGPARPMQPTPFQIDSMRSFVGFSKLKFDHHGIRKSDPRTQLDFGGIGQGFAVDVIAEFLKQKGIVHILVELGGEGLALGKNILHDRNWRIGILDPASTENEQRSKLYVAISGMSFTTSGNYFNYREIRGKRYGHTISPFTGYPVEDELLSASVFAKDCATADAWATAFMVMGLKKSIEAVGREKNLDAIFFYAAPDGEIRSYLTPRIQTFLISEDLTNGD